MEWYNNLRNLPRIDWVYRLALSRRPFAVERQWSQELLGQQAKLLDDGKHSEDEIQIKALTELCQTVLNTNEFLYLEWTIGLPGIPGAKRN